jgi:hypothetical protein
MTPPTEQELRNHFGDKLAPDEVIEVIPHTTIWATKDGVLLWEWRNGYVELVEEPDERKELLTECLEYIEAIIFKPKPEPRRRLIAKLKEHLAK